MHMLGRRGMVASPHYMATAAGAAVLRQGGNAVDAAIATNSVLAVVTPYLCGIGGDLFALVRTPDGDMIGLNGSGRAPEEATPERVRELSGSQRMPERGPLPINVPGCVRGWQDLHDRFGRLPLGVVLQEAIRLAHDGFPVTYTFARTLELVAPMLHPDTPAAATYLPGGHAPTPGSILRLPQLAATLTSIANDGAASFYSGDIAREITRSIRAIGGLISEDDLRDHRSDWVQPLSVRYRDVDVYELPPNTQGIVALMMLAALEQLSADLTDEAERVHALTEAARLAYAERDAHLTDLEHMVLDPRTLLTPEHAHEFASRIKNRATAPAHPPEPGDTAYMCAADNDGLLVSLIESNFMGIGSGVMAGETGVMLHNRGAWFSLDPGHVNVIAPRKRTMHTLMPGMALRDGKPWLVFGTMGGSGQPQIHAQILTRILDQGLSIGEAIDAPRFDAVIGVGEGGKPGLAIEGRFDNSVIENVRARGNAVQVLEPYTSQMGHAHAIEVLPDGVYAGASDPRTEGLALGW